MRKRLQGRRRVMGIGAGVVLAGLAASPAGATIVVTGGGAALHATGDVDVTAADPFGTGQPLFEQQSFDESKSIDNSAGSRSEIASGFIGVFDPNSDNSIAAASAYAHASQDVLYDGLGNLTLYNFLYETSMSIAVDESVLDPNSGDLARAISRASVVNFVDLAISGTSHQLDASLILRNDNLGNDSAASHFFFLADITGGGFSFVELLEDSVRGDGFSESFVRSWILQAGHDYRLGMLSDTDHACTETANAGLCPAYDPNDPNTSVPLAPGGYYQSGQVSAALSFTQVVPEPGTALLLGVGLIGLARARRIQR